MVLLKMGPLMSLILLAAFSAIKAYDYHIEPYPNCDCDRVWENKTLVQWVFKSKDGELEGKIDSPDAEHEHCLGKTFVCVWDMIAGDPWMAVEVAIHRQPDIEWDYNVDYGIIQELSSFHNKSSVEFIHEYAHIERDLFTSGMGNGYILWYERRVPEEKGGLREGLQATFRRYPAFQWSGIGEGALGALCKNSDRMLFLGGSCYFIGNEFKTHGEAANQCHQDPLLGDHSTKAYLALINSKARIRTLNQEIHRSLIETNTWISLEKDEGKWKFGKKWPARGENMTSWFNGVEPTEYSCGIFKSVNNEAGLGARECGTKLRPLCQLDSKCACPQIHYEATSKAQEIKSPNYDDGKYCAPLNCMMYISGSAQPESRSFVKVKLTFTNFGTYDHINIFEHDEFHHPQYSEPIAVWTNSSGTGEGSVVESHGHELLLEFVSNPHSMDATKQFTIEYQAIAIPCKCAAAESPSMHHNTTYNYTSPGYPGDYCDNQNCSITIKPQDNYAVQIDMNLMNFGIEQGFDWVYLKKDNAILSEYTGWNPTHALPSQFTYAPDESISIQFVSDYSMTSSGFNISYKLVEQSCSCPGVTTFSKKTYVNISKTMEEDKCSFGDCVYVIRKPDTPNIGQMWVNISIAFGDYNYKNYLKFQYGEYGAPGYHELLPFEEYYYNMNNYDLRGLPANHEVFTVWFHVEEVFNANISFNLEMAWKPPCECGNLNLTATTSQNQSLFSPQYPYQYCRNMTCKYTINGEASGNIKLTVDFMHLDWNDYIQISEPDPRDPTKEKIIDKLNDRHENRTYHSLDKVMYIEFTAPPSTSHHFHYYYPGFELTYELVGTKTDPDKQKGGIIKNINGKAGLAIAIICLLVLIAIVGFFTFRWWRGRRVHTINAVGGIENPRYNAQSDTMTY